LVTFRLDRRMIPEEEPERVERELRRVIEASAVSAGIKIEIRRIYWRGPHAAAGRRT